MDGIHDERTLHRHHGAIAAVDALDLSSNQTIGRVRQAKAAIAFRNGDAQKAHLAHLLEDGRVGLGTLIRINHPRCQAIVRIGARRVADHAFLFGELVVQTERIGPVERSEGRSFGGKKALSYLSFASP